MNTKQSLLALMVAASVGVSGTSHAVEILYTGEGDSTVATDQATADGAQNGTFSAAGVSIGSNAAFGSSAYSFAGQEDALSTIEVAGTSGTNLGSTFTLAAFVDATTTGSSAGAMQRVLSNFAGSGPIDNVLVFDFDPDASASFGLRLLLNGTIIKASSSSTAAAGYFDGNYHHVAVTYNNGAVQLYLDGATVGGGTAGSGAPNIGTNHLFIGEDDGVPTADGDQFIGDMDDILILGTALTPTEIADIAQNGAAQFIPEPGTFGLLGAGLLCLLVRRRK